MKNIRTFLFALSAVVLLASCAQSSPRSVVSSNAAGKGLPAPKRTEPWPDSIRLTAPADGAEECLLTDGQLKFVKMSREERRSYFADEDCRKEMASYGYYPRAVKLSWENDNDAVEEYKVILSTTADFADGTCTEYLSKEKSVDVDNLMIATKYYWKVQGGVDESAVRTFVTSDIAPRLLRVPKVRNFRDLGGRIGLDGRRVKQNMVFRTAGLNRNASVTYYTLEELMAEDANVRKIKESFDKMTALLQEPNVKLLPELVSLDWMVFKPAKDSLTAEDVDEIIAMKEIPESLMGGDGVKMTGGRNDNAIRLESSHEYMPVVFMQQIDAPEDGLVPFRCGGDWYWRLAVNNELVFDRWSGNAMNTGKRNYVLALPVKKGRNIVTVVLGSGSNGCSWHYGPISASMDNAKYISAAKTSFGIPMQSLKRIIKKDADGNQMFKKGAPYVTEEGAKYMLDVLGIKSDIDLRSDTECMGMTGSPLGDDVTWFHISSSSYGGMADGGGRKAFTEVFKVFLDEKNYPIDFHCIAGQDRTGAVAFIVNALLGVCEEELYLDWEVTGFYNNATGFRHETRFDKLVNVFDRYEGATINERVEKYVLSLGFTNADIQHLRDIMLEK